MSLEQLRQFALKIICDPELAAICSSDRASDADDQATLAREAGFDVHPSDLVNCQNGALVENVDEDFFMKSTWWNLVEGINVSFSETVDFDGDGVVDAIRIGDKWVLQNDES